MFTAIATAAPVPGSSTMPLSQQGANVDLAQAGSSRPLYPRTQYTISRAHVTLDQAGENRTGSEPFHILSQLRPKYASFSTHIGMLAQSHISTDVLRVSALKLL
jgi:hypothetical protein